MIIRLRTSGTNNYIFAMNFSDQPKSVALGNTKGLNLCNGEKAGKTLALAPYGVAVIKTGA